MRKGSLLEGFTLAFVIFLSIAKLPIGAYLYLIGNYQASALLLLSISAIELFYILYVYKR